MNGRLVSNITACHLLPYPLLLSLLAFRLSWSLAAVAVARVVVAPRKLVQHPAQPLRRLPRL